MQTFKIKKNIEIVCDAKRTRNGFKHEATLLLDGHEQETVKINYLNRTWERYEYESVLEKLVEQSTALSKSQKITCKKYIKNEGRVEDDLKPLKAVSLVASLGDIFETNQKKKNDWKVRMLKAGLENKGLIIPDDWDTLSEVEKEKRLNGALQVLQK